MESVSNYIIATDIYGNHCHLAF